MKFKDKIAVVTGGGNGLGAGICKKLAQEGALVFVTDIDYQAAESVAKTIVAQGLKAKPLQLDVTQKQDIEDLASYIYKEHGYIDYWVNNAGISKILPFLEHTEEIWDSTLDINLKGQFLCSQVAIKHMLANGGGGIINMSSQSGKVGTNNYQAYCASKFGVIGLTQSLAKEFAAANIRVNSVCPGVIETPMWDEQRKDYGAKKDIESDEVMDYFRSKIPLQRIGTEEDVANMVAFLLSDDASYITGQAVNVNGGDIMF